MGYGHLLKKYVNAEILTSEEITGEYSRLIDSYTKWNQAMMKNPEIALDFSRLLDLPGPLKILDFACGMGAITKALVDFLKSHNIEDYHITAVDGAQQFINHARSAVSSNRVDFIHQEGMAFLEKQTEMTYSAIFCGWALPYFPRTPVFRQWARLLHPQGLLALVSNRQGTLKHIESIFLDVMSRNPKEVNKIMNTARNLPKNTHQLSKTARSAGLIPLKATSHSRSFSFTTAEELLDWLLESGALAGVKKIFYDFEKLRPEITEKIAKQCYSIIQGRFEINHDFICALFQKPSH